MHTESSRQFSQQPSQQSAQELSQRLDDMPLGRTHYKVLVGSGVGWALDAMDVGLISFILAALVEQWNMSEWEADLLASIGFVGMALGASLGGLLADRIGRKQVFALTLVVYGLATGASALVGGLTLLLVLRFFVGLGLGAELPVASTYVSEFAPSRIRGRLIVILEGFWAVGWTAAAVIGFLVVPASANGWRWAFVIGGVPALYALVVRWALPESPRWLAGAGRVAEAADVVAQLEEGVTTGRREPEVEPGVSPLPADVGSVRVADSAVARLTGLWSPEFRLRTASIWVIWLAVNFAYYGAFIWIPSMLVAAGFSLVKSFGFTLIITVAQLPGYATAAWLIEKWGRRPTLSVFLIGSAGAAVAYGTAGSELAIILAGMALSFFNLGAWGALYAITPEIYPTSLRGTGAGWAAGVGRLSSIVAPFAVTSMLALGGVGLAFTVFAACFLVATIATWGLVDRRGAALDDR